MHLHKYRVKPASSLFNLARASLHQYPPLHERLDVIAVLGMIDQWQQRLESEHFNREMLAAEMIPQLQLKEPAAVTHKRRRIGLPAGEDAATGCSMQITAYGCFCG